MQPLIQLERETITDWEGGLTLVRSHVWRKIVSIVGHRVKRSFSRASVTMGFFDEIDCELDESFILQSEEGK